MNKKLKPLLKTNKNKPQKYHCYFAVKYPEGYWPDGTKVKYFSVKGSIKRIKMFLDTYFLIYPFQEELTDYPVGFWGRLMKLSDYKINPTDNSKVLLPMQKDTKVLERWPTQKEV